MGPSRLLNGDSRWAPNFWGTGIFIESARAVVAFTFTAIVETERLEARSCVQNGRGNGALQKLGATREGVLRQSFLRNGEYHDQVLWSILSPSACIGVCAW